MIFTLLDIKNILNIKFKKIEDRSIYIKNISTDTRTIKKNDIFVAIKGKYFNGHDFINKAIKKGATAIIGNEECLVSIDYLKVKNSLKAYQKLASFYRKKNKYKIIAVTGSSGKTTTKDMIYTILSKKYKIEKTINNNNNEIGLPLTILSSKKNTKILILEMGMRGLGQISCLAKIAKPDIGIITNIGVAHIGKLGSQKNIFKAKKELFDEMNSGIILINGDDKLCKLASKDFKGEKHIFGFNKDSTISASDIKFKNLKTYATIIRGKDKLKVRFPFVGKHLLLDALISLEVGYIFNIPIKEGVKFLNDFKISSGRMEILKINKITVINDTYNSNPESLKESLLFLKNCNARKIVILGDMLELGKYEKKYHEEIGELVVKLKIDYLITIGKASKYIISKAIKEGMSKDSIFASDSIENVLKYLLKKIKINDIILVKGSNGMNMKEIIKNIKESLNK